MPATAPPDLPPRRRAPLADRIRQRRAQLLAAGFELMAEHGASGVTVREVCVRAHLNPRYFYESFADLETLMVAVLDGLVAEMLPRVLTAIAAAPEHEPAKTEAAIRAGFTFLTADPRRIGVLLADPLGTERLALRRRQLVQFAADQMAAQASSFYGIPRDARLLRATTYLLTGGLIEMLIAWGNGTLELTVGELITDAAALVSGTGQAAWRIAGERAAS
jgi:AcrR family transcriptional regulator